MTIKDLQEDKYANLNTEPLIYGLDVYDNVELLGTYYGDVDDKVIVRKNNKITLCKLYYTPTDRAYFKTRGKTYYISEFLPKILK